VVARPSNARRSLVSLSPPPPPARTHTHTHKTDGGGGRAVDDAARDLPAQDAEREQPHRQVSAAAGAAAAAAAAAARENESGARGLHLTRVACWSSLFSSRSLDPPPIFSHRLTPSPPPHTTTHTTTTTTTLAHKAPGRRARRGERQAVPVPRVRVPHDRPEKVHGPQRQGPRAPAPQAHGQVDAVPARQGAGALPPPRRHAPRPQAAEPARRRHDGRAVPEGGRPRPGPRVQRAGQVVHARDRDAVVPRAGGAAGVGVLRVPGGHVVGRVHLRGARAQGERKTGRRRRRVSGAVSTDTTTAATTTTTTTTTPKTLTDRPL